MPAIAQLGSIITVTPGDEIQICYAPGHHEFIDDRTPFTIKVSGTYEENGSIIGVHGNVISGPDRYRDRIATLFIRTDNSDWRRDNISGVSFKVGASPARRNQTHSYFHPEGSDLDYPFIIRHGSADSRAQGEPRVNTGKEIFDQKVASGEIQLPEGIEHHPRP